MFCGFFPAASGMHEIDEGLDRTGDGRLPRPTTVEDALVGSKGGNHVLSVRDNLEFQALLDRFGITRPIQEASVLANERGQYAGGREGSQEGVHPGKTGQALLEALPEGVLGKRRVETALNQAGGFCFADPGPQKGFRIPDLDTCRVAGDVILGPLAVLCG